MNDMFRGSESEGSSFNQDISSWNVVNVANTANMFYHASSFDGNLSSWDVSNITDMSRMFMYASSFDGNLSSWDVSNVTDMSRMFNHASSFNQPVENWDVSNVTDMSRMFMYASSFNQPVGNWDVSNVTDMSSMFMYASSFDGNLSSWDVSNVTDMSWMFNHASSFNQPVGNWDVSNVTDMSWMFDEASSFNQTIGDWDVSNVIDMYKMFNRAVAFNQDISNWDVSSVTNMSAMFYEASSFNQDISNWCVTNIASEPTDFSISSPLTESNKPVWGTCPSSPYEWINYGTQDWTVENAEMVTYRDGTPIPQVTDATEWANLTTGAWCYYDNDPTKGKLYNWYAVAGIHDNDPNTPNKELAPEGWHVPSVGEWSTLGNYLITNGYNFDGTTTGNKIAKSMSSTAGWAGSTIEGSPGNNQLENNSSGFNSLPVGYGGGDYFEGYDSMSFFWTSEFFHSDAALYKFLKNFQEALNGSATSCKTGMSVRFVRDATSLSTTDFSNSITIYPNPVKNMLTIDGLVVKDIVIYSVLGKVVLKMSNQNTIDVSSLSKGVYFIKVSDGINASTKKFIKD
jgi:uncharacterized protein (TIGR02145 family)